MVCRFCLDNRQTRKNPFLSPCECRGSVEHVHFVCLQKWRITNPPVTLNTCPLCKATYQLPEEFQGESLPALRMEHFLNCPELYAFTLFYFFCFHASWAGGTLQPIEQWSGVYALSFESCFLIMAARNWQVKAVQQYREEWSKRGASVALWFHVFIWLSWLALQNKTPLLLLPYSMRCLWRTHIEILQRRNDELLVMLPRYR